MLYPGKKWAQLFHIHPWQFFLAVTLFACFLHIIWFPKQILSDPASTVIVDKEGSLLGALIADDGQWRFPYDSIVPEKFRKCILTFEDKNFYRHNGFDPSAILRATYQNFKSRSVVSGASTITMQVIRLSRKGKPRNIAEKIIEIILASRLELSHTKDEILALYASNAPFGGNVVGLDAASWRYFGRKPDGLSWAESATLAVLPNAPSLIHPGRNRDDLLKKRNHLLKRLFRSSQIDSISYQLALLEPLPEKPLSLPAEAPHLLERINKDHKGQIVKTTIDPELQHYVNYLINKHYQQLKFNHIYNIAVLVADNETGNVLAYNGNVISENYEGNGEDVDLITAPRSSGSVLKPLLYASMLDKGELLPNTLIPDVPTHYAGFSPQNYDHTYSGAVPAGNALARSLNVPAVRMLKQYGVERFHYLLRELGFSTITYPAGHYGLSLILGGAEITLWDLAGVYSGLSRNLIHYAELNDYYDPADLHALNLVKNNKKNILSKHKLQNNNILSASSLYITFNVMVEVNRPDAESSWKFFNSSHKIAWKTGTSYGNRDAWALGLTKKYTVGVWVGNASGEGRPLLTGLNAAAPVLFDVFDHLPASEWFRQPYDDMTEVAVCHKSGYRASQNCPEIDSVWIPVTGLRTIACPYHILIHLDKDGNHRVNSACYPLSEMVHKKWFVLPPVMEWYYKSHNPDYQVLPPYLKNCNGSGEQPSFDLIYPVENTKVFVPLDFGGVPGSIIMKAAVRDQHTVLFWHLDEEYLGSTVQVHQMAIRPDSGRHILTLVDDAGNRLERHFTVENAP